MRRIVYTCAFLVALIAFEAEARVDTLRDTSDVHDCIIYSYEDCNPDVEGEDCRRYNGGAVVNMGIGAAGPSRTRRVLMSFPGWDGIVPDSSALQLFCHHEDDTLDRRLFVYPLTRSFCEGNESAYTIGDYPDEDSGATWLHSFLDIGDGDSVLWTSSGGDYITAVACTALFSSPQTYRTFDHFNRILTYWDTSGSNHGLIVINENAFPANSAGKAVRSSEGPVEDVPLLVLYYPDTMSSGRRRRMLCRPAE